MNAKTYLTALSSAFAAIVACAEHHHAHTAECSHDHPPKTIRLSLAHQRTMGLKTVHAEKRRISSSVAFAGRYELNPDARQAVSSPVSGRLALLVKPLSDVKKGDALFTVFSPDLIARSHEIKVLEKRLSVYREIKTANAALENELAVKRAEREAMLAGADEKDGVVTVRAAKDGMIESLRAKDGQWLETGAAVIETVRTRDLRFKALVSASDALKLKDGMPAKAGKNFGRIKTGVGDDSGLVPVYVLFDTLADAIAGERVYAECVTDQAETPHLAVPSKSIVTIGVQSVVFVRDAHNPECFTPTHVTTGLSGGGWTAISIPSSAHDTHHSSCISHGHHIEVVTEGAYELKLAHSQSSEAKPAGHFHADGTFHEGEH